MTAKILVSLLFFGSVAMAEVYNVDTTASRIDWKAGKKMGSFHTGSVKVKSGKIETDAKGALKSADVVADMKSISNEDLKDKPDMQGKLVGHLSSDDFFKVEKYPEASFKLKSVTLKAGSKDEYTVKGDLSMIGKTETIEFPAKFSADKGTLTGTGTATIERLKWGLQYGSGSIFKSLTADKIINDTFEITLHIVAKK